MRSRTDLPERSKRLLSVRPCKRLLSVLLAVTFAISTPALAAAQDGYVTLQGTNQLLVYDPANPTGISSVIGALGGTPNGVAVSPDGNFAYFIVGTTVRRLAGGAIDAGFNVALTGAALPEQIAVSPDGNKLFITDGGFGNNKLFIINLAASNGQTTISGASGAWGVDAVTTTLGDRAYVSLASADEVKVFDAASNALLATVPVGDIPQGVAASPLGDRVYVANFNDDSVSVIDTATNSVFSIAGVGDGPQELTVSADGTLVYVTLKGAGDVAVINTTDYSVDTVDLVPATAADSLHGISFSADGAFVVVAHFLSRRVSVIDPSNGNSVVTTVLSGTPAPKPRYVAFQPLAPPVNTPAGTNVAVTPVDETTGDTPVSVTFVNVTVAGDTTLTTAETGPTLPAGFVLGTPPVYFDISTTAEFTDVLICINYGGMAFVDEDTLALLHYDDDTNNWQDATTSLDTTNDVICGTVTSLSIFVVAELEPDNPPTLTSDACGQTLTPALGDTVSFTVNADDDNGVTLSVSGLPAGATMSPGLPDTGTGLSSVFSWTPTGADAGIYEVTFTAADGVNSPISCVVTIVVPEDPGGVVVDFLGFQLHRAQINSKSNHSLIFWFNGNFEVDLVNGDGVNPTAEDVVLTVEGTEFVIPAGSFDGNFGGRLFRFHDLVGDTRLLVHITWVRGGVYNLNVTGWDANLPNLNNPLELCVRIGDDFGCDEISGKIE